MLPVLLFPNINPIAVKLGPFAIHWYALAYIVGILLGWFLLRRLVIAEPMVATREQVDDFLCWAIFGIILGGRLGYVLFYQPAQYMAAPWDIVKLWQGGMSFHGGALGLLITTWLFCWKNHLNYLGFADRLVVVVPLGLFLGRIANFVNGELWGNIAPPTLPWAMIFPLAGPFPRHPSQIYEALLEGVLLFCIMSVAVSRQSARQRYGYLSGVFLLGYALVRSLAECFRQPDIFLGYLTMGLTMGQLLSIPMAVLGILLIYYSYQSVKSVRL